MLIGCEEDAGAGTARPPRRVAGPRQNAGAKHVVTFEGQSGVADRRGRGHRAGDRRSLRRRRRAGDRHGHRSQGLGRARGRTATARRPLERSGRGAGARGRADRHSLQLRWLRASRQRAGMLGRRLGFLVRPQRQIDASHDPGVSAGHAGKGRRFDRQRRLGRLVGARHRQSLRLRRLEGGGDRPDQGGGGRFHSAWRALQRDLPGHGGEPVARPAHRDAQPRRQANPSSRCARLSSIASRWAGSARRRRSRCSRSISPRTKAPSRPGQIHLVDGGFAL